MWKSYLTNQRPWALFSSFNDSPFVLTFDEDAIRKESDLNIDIPTPASDRIETFHRVIVVDFTVLCGLT